MAIKFPYIDTDSDVYTAFAETSENLVEPFDPDSLKSDSKNYLKEVIKDTKEFIKYCKDKDYYDADRWTSLNTKFTLIFEEIRSKETDPETNKLTDYYETDVRPILQAISKYSKYLRQFYKENTERYLLAKSFNPREKNKEYTEWIVKELKEKRIQSTDKESVKNYLEIYDGLPEEERKSLSQLNIHTLFDYLEEMGLVNLNMNEGNLKKQQKKYLDGKMKDCRIIFQGTVEDENWTVYEMTSISSIMAMANNTRWCTLHQNNAQSYIKKCGRLVAFYKNGKPYAQLEPSTGEFKDKKDVEISTSFNPPYRLQDSDLFKVVKAIKDPLFTEIQDWSRHGLPFYKLVLPADPASEDLLDQLKDYPADEIHNELKLRIIKRFKILEPRIFEDDASYMITEPYMKSWAESNEDRNPKLEEFIKTKPNWALSYACNIIRGAWPEGEEAIFKADNWDDYLRYALKMTVKDFLIFKLKIKVKTVSELSQHYGSIVEFCQVLREDQRNGLEADDYSLTLFKEYESADYLLIHAYENYLNPLKFMKIKVDNDKITEIKNLSGDNEKEYVITNLTQEIYKLFKTRETSDKSIRTDILALKDFMGTYKALSSTLDASNIDLVNTLPKNNVIEKVFFEKVEFTHSFNKFNWVELIAKIKEWKINNPHGYMELEKKYINQLKSIFDINPRGDTPWQVNRAIDYYFSTPQHIFFKYFIFSNYYSTSTLIKLLDLFEDLRPVGEYKNYVSLLIEKAVKCQETSDRFWTSELFELLKKSTGRAVLIEKKSTRDPDYVKSLVENVPVFATELKKLFDKDYKRAVVPGVKNKKNLETLNFVDILSMLDNVKVPKKELVKSSFDQLSELERYNIIISFAQKNEISIPDIISKFYKKNIGFIELFDLIDLSHLRVPDRVDEFTYVNPFLLLLVNQSTKDVVKFKAYYFNKVKDLPDFKNWIKKQKEKNKDVNFLYDEEKAIEPDSNLIDNALENLEDLQYEDPDYEGRGTYYRYYRYDPQEFQSSSIGLIVANNLSLPQLKRLRTICPGLFVQYINLYRFSDDKQNFIDKAILNLLKETIGQGSFMQTYSDFRKKGPGGVLSALLPYLSAHHPLKDKDSLDEYTEKLIVQLNKGRIGEYTNPEQLKARIIREIKRFNK